jgi:hypothetical protein
MQQFYRQAGRLSVLTRLLGGSFPSIVEFDRPEKRGNLPLLPGFPYYPDGVLDFLVLLHHLSRLPI